MYPLILPVVSKNIIDKGRKSICVTVSLRTYMYSQLFYLHVGGSYTSFTQLEAEIYALEYKCASNTGPFSLLFLTLWNPRATTVDSPPSSAPTTGDHSRHKNS